MAEGALLMSIRPEHAENIFIGVKTVELRRTRPRVSKGSKVLVYASSPTQALIGFFEVEGVVEGTPSSLWRQVGQFAAITRKQFNEYFTDAEAAFGIVVGEVTILNKALSLAHLRKRMPGFRPPQSYCYLGTAEAKSISGNPKRISILSTQQKTTLPISMLRRKRSLN